MVRDLFEPDEFLEVFVSAPLEVCERRDPKGLYKRARAGEIPFFTGIDSAYEVPENAAIELNTASMSAEECANQLIEYMIDNDYID